MPFCSVQIKNATKLLLKFHYPRGSRCLTFYFCMGRLGKLQSFKTNVFRYYFVHLFSLIYFCNRFTPLDYKYSILCSKCSLLAICIFLKRSLLAICIFLKCSLLAICIFLSARYSREEFQQLYRVFIQLYIQIVRSNTFVRTLKLRVTEFCSCFESPK